MKVISSLCAHNSQQLSLSMMDDGRESGSFLVEETIKIVTHVDPPMHVLGDYSILDLWLEEDLDVIACVTTTSSFTNGCGWLNASTKQYVCFSTFDACPRTHDQKDLPGRCPFPTTIRCRIQRPRYYTRTVPVHLVYRTSTLE